MLSTAQDRRTDVCIEAGSRVSLANSDVLISRTVAGFSTISGWKATILADGIAARFRKSMKPPLHPRLRLIERIMSI